MPPQPFGLREALKRRFERLPRLGVAPQPLQNQAARGFADFDDVGQVPRLRIDVSMLDGDGERTERQVGTILGRYKVNIANFALGRNDRGAVGVVNVDEEADSPSVLDTALAELRKVPAIREAWVVRLT